MHRVAQHRALKIFGHADFRVARPRVCFLPRDTHHRDDARRHRHTRGQLRRLSRGARPRCITRSGRARPPLCRPDRLQAIGFCQAARRPVMNASQHTPMMQRRRAREFISIWATEGTTYTATYTEPENSLRTTQSSIALRQGRSPAPVRLEIERQLSVMPDRQQIEIRVNLRVQHQVVVEDVFAQRFRVRRQRR